MLDIEHEGVLWRKTPDGSVFWWDGSKWVPSEAGTAPGPPPDFSSPPPGPQPPPEPPESASAHKERTVRRAIVAVVVVFLAVAVIVSAVTAPEAKCNRISADDVDSIASGVRKRIDPPPEFGNKGYIVQSNDYPDDDASIPLFTDHRVYFVAVEVDGEPGVWVFTEPTGGLIYAANGVAWDTTIWGEALSPLDIPSEGDHGFDEAIDCLTSGETGG